MLRPPIDPEFAKQVELDRPADSWAERLFRFSLYAISILCTIAGILHWFLDKEGIIEKGGKLAEAASILYIFTTTYALNYLVWRFVKSMAVRIAWWSLMAIILLLILGSR